MAYLTKEQYDRRARNARMRNEDNAEVAQAKGLTEEQTYLLSELCGARHEMHCNIERIIYSGAEYGLKTLEELTDDINTSGLPLLNFGKYESDICHIDIDTIDVLYEIEQVPDDDDERDEWLSAHYNEIYEQLEDVNRIIEDYLSNIDKQYGTHYSPTGIQRLH